MEASRTVLITRPEPGLSETIKRVQAMGWHAIACPVMTVHTSAPLPVLERKVIAITSAQALPALSHQLKNSLLLTVGEKTALRARQAGFTNVFSAKGTRDSLVELCNIQGFKGKDITFVCGRGWQGQAYSHAVVKKIGAKWVEGYCVKKVNNLSEEAVQALLGGGVRTILFYSIETVRFFLSLCPIALYPYFEKIRALCLSAEIAQCVKVVSWRDVRWGSPNDILEKI